MSNRLQYCVQSMESWSEFGYLTFQFSVTMAMMPCSLRVMGDSSAGVAQVPQELSSSNINQAKSTSCRLLYTSTRPLAPFQSCRVKGGLWKGANGLVLVYSSLHEVLFAWLMFELLSSWGTCATPADESPITLRLQGIIAMVTENWNVRYPNSDQLSIDCTQYWSRLLIWNWFYVCLMSVHCARILSHDSGQAWQLYCRVKGGLWKGANGLVLVYSSLHEVLFAWLMFELLSSWGTCATPADESPITLRLQGIIAMVTENWNVRYPNSDQLSIDCTQCWSRLLIWNWFYVCLMSVHCARILSHDMQWAGMAALPTFHSAVELPCLPTVMTQNSCTMHRHQTYIKSIPNEQSTSILCAIDGKLIRIWISHISVLSHHGDDAL